MNNSEYRFSLPRVVGKYLKYFYYDLSGIKVIHCIGDSHAGLFNYYRNHNIFKKTVFKVFSIGGATAMGINNINSKTKARLWFNNYLKFVKKNQTLLFVLGEVDCDFVIWIRARKYKTDVKKQLDVAIRRYQTYLDFLLKQGFKHIILYSVPLPTIRKNQSKGLVSELRKNANVSIQKRTEITISFNKIMKRYCHKKGIKYLDLTNLLLNKKTNIIDDKFTNPNKLDHHLYDKAVISLVTPLLNRIGYY